MFPTFKGVLSIKICKDSEEKGFLENLTRYLPATTTQCQFFNKVPSCIKKSPQCSKTSTVELFLVDSDNLSADWFEISDISGVALIRDFNSFSISDVILYLLLLMKFVNHYIYKTPLVLAIDKRNVEIVKLLLEIPEIDVNIMSIFN